MSHDPLDSGEHLAPHERRRSSDALVEALRGELRAFRKELLDHAAREEQALNAIRADVAKHTEILIGDGHRKGLVELVRSEADAANEVACRVAKLERTVAGTDETPGHGARIASLERAIVERSAADSAAVSTLQEIAKTMGEMRTMLTSHDEWITSKRRLETWATTGLLGIVGTVLFVLLLKHAPDILAFLKG